MNSGHTLSKHFNKSSETKLSNLFYVFSIENTNCSFLSELDFYKSSSSFGENYHCFGENCFSFGENCHSFGKNNECFGEKNECFNKNNECFGENIECFGEKNANSSNKRVSIAPLYYPIYIYKQLIINNYVDN